MELLRQTIRPEFLNRVDEVIMFQPLLKKEIKGIIRIQLDNLSKMLEKNGVDLRFTEYAMDYLAENGYDPQYGARPLKRLIQKAIVNPLSKKILAEILIILIRCLWTYLTVLLYSGMNRRKGRNRAWHLNKLLTNLLTFPITVKYLRFFS